MKPCPERTIWSSSFSAGSDPILQHTFPRPAAHYGGVIALFRPTRREALSVFALGAAGYPLLEVCWRGRTHASMALAGGLAFLWIFREHAARRPLWARCLRGALGAHEQAVHQQQVFRVVTVAEPVPATFQHKGTPGTLHIKERHTPPRHQFLPQLQQVCPFGGLKLLPTVGEIDILSHNEELF